MTTYQNNSSSKIGLPNGKYIEPGSSASVSDEDVKRSPILRAWIDAKILAEQPKRKQEPAADE